MYSKFNNLAFVIGLFFTIISLVLLAGYFIASEPENLNLYTGIGFLIFGLAMMFSGDKKANGKKTDSTGLN